MRIIRITNTPRTAAARVKPPEFSVGQVVDVRSNGDGKVTASGVDKSTSAMTPLPKGIFRARIVTVHNPDFYVNNVVGYLGKMDDGRLIWFDDSTRTTLAGASSDPAGIGASKR